MKAAHLEQEEKSWQRHLSQSLEERWKARAQGQLRPSDSQEGIKPRATEPRGLTWRH